MTAESPRRRYWLIGLLVVVALVFAGSLIWYGNTDAFQAMARRRVISEIENITGGRVELDSIHAIPFRFRVEVRGLTIHGKESESEIPLAHIDSLTAKIKVISVLGFTFGFDSVELEHPVVHLIIYPDGTTNQTVPKVAQNSDKNVIQRLFAFSINHLAAHNGTLFFNEQRIPLDFTIEDVVASLDYSILRRRYDGKLGLGRVESVIQTYRPFAWNLKSEFTVGVGNLVVHSFEVHSGKSKLTAAGGIEKFSAPKLDLRYDVFIDAQETAAILRKPEIRKGDLQLSGSGSWTSMENFFSTGKVTLRQFDWRDDYTSLRDVALAGNFAVSPKQLSLLHIEGRALGGNVAGEAALSNWMNSSARTGRSKAASEASGLIKLRVKDAAVPDIAAALSARNRRLDQLRVAGIAAGTLDVKWKGSLSRAEYAISASVVPPAHLSPNQLPLSAQGEATYRAQSAELQLSNLVVSTPASRVQASGTLSSSASLKISASTSNLNDWKPLIAMLHGPESLPVDMHGHAAFVGTANGDLSHAVVGGNLTANDFDVRLPATSTASARTAHWDSLNTAVTVSQHGLALHDGSLQEGDATVRFDARAGLYNWAFVGDSSINASLDIEQAELSDLIALAGLQYPVSGGLSLSLQISGTRADPNGSGHFTLAHGVVYGQPVERITSDFAIANQELSFQHLLVSDHGALVSGSGQYSWTSSDLKADLSGSGFELSRVAQLQTARGVVNGTLNFKAHVSGTSHQPNVDGVADITNLSFDHQAIGNFEVEGKTRGGELALTGRSQFQRSTLSFDGSIHLADDFPMKMSLVFGQLDVHPLLNRYLAGQVMGASPISGNATVSGPLKHPDDLAITADLRDFRIEMENITVHNEGDIRFSLAQKRLQIEQLHLVGEGTDMSSEGSVELADGHQLDLRARGKLNMHLLSTYNQDFTAAGLVDADIAVSGTVSNPVLQGHLKIQNGSIAYIDAPSALSNINGSINFNRNRAEIENLTAYTGGGRMTFHGFVTSYNRQVNFDLGMSGQDVRLRYPPGVSSTANVELRYAGTITSSTLSGDVMVTKLGMTPGFDFGAYLQRSAQASSLPQTNAFMNSVRLDVHVLTVPELQMQTAVVRLSGDADLQLRGTAAKPVLLGRADVIEGEAYFNGTKYRLERGDVAFTSPVTTTPVLDLQATTRIRDYDITLNVNGEVEKLNLTYRSEPPLPTADIVALLAFGQTTEESAQLQQTNNSAFSSGVSSALLGEALNATLGNRVQKLFGVSRIKIDPNGFATETSPAQTGPAVTIEQQVKNNLTVTYTTNVNQASQQIIQVEYNVTRNISIVGLRDQNGVVSFVTKIRRRKQ
jgi:translocation and assembly module TamB